MTMPVEKLMYAVCWPYDLDTWPFDLKAFDIGHYVPILSFICLCWHGRRHSTDGWQETDSLQCAIYSGISILGVLRIVVPLSCLTALMFCW